MLQRRLHRGLVTPDAGGELAHVGHRARLGPDQPRRQPGNRPCAQRAHEVLR
jgi:hypothetical protein